MASLEKLYERLYQLSSGLHTSDTTFASPEQGFKQLATLVANVSKAVKEAETQSASLPGDDSRHYAAEATRAAASAADAAAKAADATTEAASIAPDARVAKQALVAAFRAATAATRAAAAARSAATSAESLPSDAGLEYREELAVRFLEESARLDSIHQLLFHDRELQLSTTIYAQIQEIGQKAVAAAASFLWDKLVDSLSRIRDSDAYYSPLRAVLDVVGDGNTTLTALLRQYLLESPAFRNPDVLLRALALEGGHMVDLGLGKDAKLRARNMSKRPDLFKEPSVPGDDDDGVEIVSGKLTDEEDSADFLTFPGRLNNLPIKPLIDTGGGCNIVKLGWLQAHGIEVDANSPRFQSLLMADGSESKRCPCVDVKWSFDGRNKVWVDVEFVVVEGYRYDALIGLPFLKKTETIHNSAGRLVFPEFKGVHAKKEAIPLYNVAKSTGSK